MSCLVDNRWALAVVWDALHEYQYNNVGEGGEANDESWDDITFAMETLHCALGVTQEEVT
jgi:hypothetical protein